MSNKNSANYLHSYLLMVCFAVVALIGLCVIVGWHFHLRSLVQIIPSTIPMQYNTALCFILLAVSAGLMITQRIPRLLPALGSSLVALMGGLVIFQYMTGILLGIDSYIVKPVEFENFVKAVSDLGFYGLLLNQTLR